MKHTPGPWRITKAGYDDKLMFKVQVGNSERTVAYAYSPTGDSTEEQTANAQLIAAAPELLEACEILHDASQDVFNLLAGSRPLITVPQALDAIVEAMSKARAAINKARGEK